MHSNDIRTAATGSASLQQAKPIFCFCFGSGRHILRGLFFFFFDFFPPFALRRSFARPVPDGSSPLNSPCGTVMPGPHSTPREDGDGVVYGGRVPTHSIVFTITDQLAY